MQSFFDFIADSLAKRPDAPGPALLRSVILWESSTKTLPSGKHHHNYEDPPFIVDFPIKNGDFP